MESLVQPFSVKKISTVIPLLTPGRGKWCAQPVAYARG
jgi:hypothetical protein